MTPLFALTGIFVGTVAAPEPPPELQDVAWGRSVDVYAHDPASGTRTLVRTDLVIGPDFSGTGNGWSLEPSALLGVDELTVHHPARSAAFEQTLEVLAAGVVPVETRPLEHTGLAPVGAVPTNATLVLSFDVPLEVEPGDVRILAGEPPVAPFAARVGIDPEDARRILIDPVLSLAEMHRHKVGEGASGFPDASSASQLNVQVDLSAAGGGAFGFRAGGPGAPQGLADGLLPQVVGRQGGVLLHVTGLGGGAFDVDFRFLAAACAKLPAPGDVIVTRTHLAAVTAPGVLAGDTVTGMQVTLASGDPAAFGVSRGLLFSAFVPGTDVPQCFVDFTPGATPLAQDVEPGASVRVRFSEAMDLASASPFDNLQIKRVTGAALPNELVVATVEAAAGGHDLSIQPVVPLDHALGTAETYYVNVVGRPDGLTDTAGNPLANPLPPDVGFSLDPSAPTVQSGGVALRFDKLDEDLDGNPELRGQFLLDLDDEEIDARPVTRFAATADRTQTVPSAMIPFAPGVQTPLSPLGAKTQHVWRYVDVGHSATDESLHNIDVEGLNWSPVGGVVVSDFYPQFEIRLAHSHFQPDEHLESTLLPAFPDSGLTTISFADNVLADPASPQKVVHDKSLGYAVNPSDLFTAPTGTPMVPFPLNQSGDPSSFEYYTWRDTAIQAKAAPNGAGIDLAIMEDLGLIPPGTAGQIAGPNEVPSFGLPLLMEYRCFADPGAVGLNAFDISLAINSSARPNFRVFSTGVDPDLELAPDEADPSFYVGQADLVVRVSRAHTVWFDTNGTSTDFADPVLEPGVGGLPPGTEIVLAFRGADSVPLEAFDADELDPYGELDPALPAVVFFQGDDTWKESIDDVDGARYLQARVTLIGDTVANVAPSLGSLGFGFLK